MGFCGVVYVGICGNVKKAGNDLKWRQTAKRCKYGLQDWTNPPRLPRLIWQTFPPWLAAGCWPLVFVGKLSLYRQTAQNGDKPATPSPLDPVRLVWGIVYILKPFSFSQKGKVHLLNIQTAICHRKCHRRRFLKWGKSSQLRTYTDHNKLHFLI